jgi:hypothetical protein
MAVVGWTLSKTAEPASRPTPSSRRWMPVAATATAMALAALLWVEVAVWRAVTTTPPGIEPDEARVMLAQVSSALFSLRGDPPSAEAAVDAGDLPTLGDEDPGIECAGADWLLRPACGAGSS